MASKFKINLDISKDNYLLIKCKQNDDLIMEASMFEYGQKLDLSNKTINIKALKADKSYIIQSDNITKNNNKMTAELDRDFTRVPGRTKIEIVLEGSGKQNTTFSFYLEVIGSVIDGAVESSNSVTIIETLDNKIAEAVQVKEETEQLINSGGAATKGDIEEVNLKVEQNASIYQETTDINLETFFAEKNIALFPFKTIEMNNSVQIINKENIRIYGRNTKFKKNKGFGHGIIEFINCKNIIIDDCDIDGMLATDGSFPELSLMNGQYGLTFHVGCKDITIKNCRFNNHMDSALTFSDDIFENPTDIIPTGLSGRMLIDNCQFTNCRQVSMTPGGFREVNITNCDFTDFLGELKLAPKGDYEWGKVIISHNRFKKFNRYLADGSPKAGIFICGCPNVDIHDNYFEDMRDKTTQYRLTGGIRIEVNPSDPKDFGNINIHDNTFINCCNDITIYGYDLVNNVSKVISNINIHDNISKNCTYHVEIFGKSFDNNFKNIKIHNNIINGENGISIGRTNLLAYGDIQVINNIINVNSSTGSGVYINTDNQEKLILKLNNDIKGIGKLNVFASVFYDSEVNKIVDILSDRFDLYEIDTQPNFINSVLPSTVTGWSISGDTSRVINNMWDGSREVSITAQTSPLVYKNSTLKANNEYLLYTKLFRSNTGDVYLSIKDSVARDKKYTLQANTTNKCYTFVTVDQSECIIYPVKSFDMSGGTIAFKNTLLINHTKFKAISGYDLKLLSDSLLSIILDRVAEKIKRYI